MAKVTKGDDGTLSVCLAPVEEGGSSEEITAVNTLLWAIGRDANVTNLGLEVAVSSLCVSFPLSHSSLSHSLSLSLSALFNQCFLNNEGLVNMNLISSLPLYTRHVIKFCSK